MTGTNFKNPFLEYSEALQGAHIEEEFQKFCGAFGTYQRIIILGNGECYEGSVWEGANFASHHRLDNLCAIIDRNSLITHGSTEDINALEPMIDKWRAFGWDAYEIDAHNIDDLVKFFSSLEDNTSKKPVALIAKSVKGKGVSFMENNASWHHGGIDDQKFNAAEKELKSKGEKND